MDSLNIEYLFPIKLRMLSILL